MPIKCYNTDTLLFNENCEIKVGLYFKTDSFTIFTS